MSVVLITGCSSGLGKLAALEFARRGDRVYASMRDLGKSQPLVSAARAEDLDIETIRLDVTQSPSIDVLVNNAGMFAVGPVEYFSDPRP